MNHDFPKDPETAAKILADLPQKDADETICRYPTCHEPCQASPGSGRPSAYCQNPEHTALTNHRARKQLKALIDCVTSAEAQKRESPVAVAQVESLRHSVVSGMRELQANLDRYMGMLAELTDPDLSAAQIQATFDRAEARIAEAQQTVSAERSLRLSAETARQTALQDARAAHDAAELAIQQMEDTETRRARQEAEAERRMAQIQADRDAEIEQLHALMSAQKEEIEAHATQAVAQAQAQTATAEKEAREAEAQARQAQARTEVAEAQARTRVETAERLVMETRATLDRERVEVDRLREELIATRTRIDTDQAHARMALDRERAEVDRLREELAAARTRIDQLNDERRTRLT